MWINPAKSRYLIVTNNHFIFTNNGLKQVKDLNIYKDKLINTILDLNSIQKQIVIGSLLGDMSARNMNHKTKNPLLSETHGIKQKPYLKWKKDILEFFFNHEEHYESAYDSNHKATKKYRIISKSLPVFKYFEFLYKEGKKHIPKNIHQYMTPLVIAIWFMDDGGCLNNDKQRARAVFHTQSFSKTEVSFLLEGLKKFNISGTIGNYGKGWQINISADSSEKLFKLISPYIHHSMKYKIPKIYYEKSFNFNNYLYNELTFSKILSKKKHNKLPNKQKYDLEIEDTHNYFAKGILVHNSNFRFFVKNGKLIFGSRTQQLTSNEGEDSNVPKNFRLCLEYIRDTLKDKDLTPYEDMILYGECMIKHTLEYDWEKIPLFIGFDIRIDENEYMHPDKARNIFEELGFEFVNEVRRYLTRDKPKEITF